MQMPPGGGDHEPAVLYALGRNQGVGEILHERRFGAGQNRFQAVIVTEMHGNARHNRGKIFVLQAVELIQQQAFAMIVD